MNKNSNPENNNKSNDGSMKPSKKSKGFYGLIGLIVIIIGIAIPYINSLKTVDSKKVASKPKTVETTKSDSQTSDETSTSSSQQQEDAQVPVQITIYKIDVTPQNEIEVTVTNNTEKDIVLPSINFTKRNAGIHEALASQATIKKISE